MIEHVTDGGGKSAHQHQLSDELVAQLREARN